jgi:hypothetical protein
VSAARHALSRLIYRSFAFVYTRSDRESLAARRRLSVGGCNEMIRRGRIAPSNRSANQTRGCAYTTLRLAADVHDQAQLVRLLYCRAI